MWTLIPENFLDVLPYWITHNAVFFNDAIFIPLLYSLDEYPIHRHLYANPDERSFIQGQGVGGMCHNCHRWYVPSELHPKGNFHYCHRCIEELFPDYHPCYYCHELLHEDDLYSVIDNSTGERIYLCHCGEVFCGSPTLRDDWGCICENCADYYTYCYDCERIVHIDDAIAVDGCWYCQDCAPEEEGDGLLSYYYKPTPVFFPYHDNSVELEIDHGYRSEFLERAERKELYFKTDGSLSSSGVEIVSHPATLFYHKEALGWEDVLEIARQCDFRSHDAGNCGLHVHVNRSFLRGKNGKKTEELNITKLLFIHERFFNKILKLSRRTQAQLNRWAKSYFGEDEEITAGKVNGIAKNQNLGRYYMINLENVNTVEFRFFRGTLNPASFFAALEWVDFICRFVLDTSIAKIVRMKWDDLVQHIDEQQDLFPSERRIA